MTWDITSVGKKASKAVMKAPCTYYVVTLSLQ